MPCPTLFIEGARDPFCHLDLLAEVLGRLPLRSDLHVIPRAGHSFETDHSAPAPELLEEICRVILGWLESL